MLITKTTEAVNYFEDCKGVCSGEMAQSQYLQGLCVVD
jgi:hypothetical protein